jgi:hypothetical protein
MVGPTILDSRRLIVLGQTSSDVRGSYLTHPGFLYALRHALISSYAFALLPVISTGSKKEEHMYMKVYKQKESKTYNSGDSLVVTHLTTNPPVHCLYMAERTGSLIFSVLWSYVKDVDLWLHYIPSFVTISSTIVHLQHFYPISSYATNTGQPLTYSIGFHPKNLKLSRYSGSYVVLT